MKPSRKVSEPLWSECSIAARESVGFTLRVEAGWGLTEIAKVGDRYPDLVASLTTFHAALKVLGLPTGMAHSWPDQPVAAREEVLFRLSEVMGELYATSSRQVTWELPQIAERFREAADAHRAAIAMLTTEKEGDE